MDWGRRPYTTQARMFRNEGPIVEIDWYEVPEDAPVLPYDSAVSSLDGTSDQLWQYMDNMGEVPWEPRPYNGLKAPAGTPNGHICGTEEDFAQGGVYDPDAPPVEVNAFGLPLCCEPAQIIRGGGAGGGVPYMDYPRRPSGGGAGGGVPVVYYPIHRAVAGGGAGGGMPAVYYPIHRAVAGGGAGGGLPRVDDGTLRYVVGGGAGGGVPLWSGRVPRAVVGGGAAGGVPVVAAGPWVVVAGGGGGAGVPASTVSASRSVVGGGAAGGVPTVGVLAARSVVGGGAGGGVPIWEVTGSDEGTTCENAITMTEGEWYEYGSTDGTDRTFQVEPEFFESRINVEFEQLSGTEDMYSEAREGNCGADTLWDGNFATWNTSYGERSEPFRAYLITYGMATAYTARVRWYYA